MNTVVFAVLVLIVFVLLVILLLLFILAVDSVVKGHDLPTSKKATKAVIKIISEHGKSVNFYDLGCARGSFAMRIKKEFPDFSVYAIDDNAIRIFFARMSAFVLRRDIRFAKKNIFDADLGDADIVYTYLWYDLMPELEKKLLKELKQGAIVITNTSKFPIWKPTQKIVTHQKISKIADFETLFVYQK